MKFGQERRHKGALERRKADVEWYKRFQQQIIPMELYGRTYTDQEEWDAVVARKLKLARADVERLTELCEAYWV